LPAHLGLKSNSAGKHGKLVTHASHRRGLELYKKEQKKNREIEWTCSHLPESRAVDQKLQKQRKINSRGKRQTVVSQ
jgi:hypothetical protein